jgi:hypothetical protein
VVVFVEEKNLLDKPFLFKYLNVYLSEGGETRYVLKKLWHYGLASLSLLKVNLMAKP